MPIESVQATPLQGCLIIKPRVFPDARGYFAETYSKREFDAILAAHGMGPVAFVQDNQSRSSRGVIRGLHFQAPPCDQTKLVRCTEGEILDVAVDIRRGSPTYGQHVAVLLSAENHLQFFIPRGFAHGFAVISERAVLQYKCDNYYAPASEGGISIADPALGIEWPISPAEAILSQRDMAHPGFADFYSPFKF